uniref:Uncharacterized protein n=1 Tax=Neospora caninum (strain Liverpool) TaxID=572307 RepID=F0JBA5_NEOCL|nr:hypothetical protein, conserved [Neospora caninum Liverpool]CEL71372.1 TPA: hypothetical protein, conserved [Neospora caninum Liverpool]
MGTSEGSGGERLVDATPVDDEGVLTLIELDSTHPVICAEAGALEDRSRTHQASTKEDPAAADDENGQGTEGLFNAAARLLADDREKLAEHMKQCRILLDACNRVVVDLDSVDFSAMKAIWGDERSVRQSRKHLTQLLEVSCETAQRHSLETFLESPLPVFSVRFASVPRVFACPCPSRWFFPLLLQRMADRLEKTHLFFKNIFSRLPKLSPSASASSPSSVQPAFVAGGFSALIPGGERERLSKDSEENSPFAGSLIAGDLAEVDAAGVGRGRGRGDAPPGSGRGVVPGRGRGRGALGPAGRGRGVGPEDSPESDGEEEPSSASAEQSSGRLSPPQAGASGDAETLERADASGRKHARSGDEDDPGVDRWGNRRWKRKPAANVDWLLKCRTKLCELKERTVHKAISDVFIKERVTQETIENLNHNASKLEVVANKPRAEITADDRRVFMRCIESYIAGLDKACALIAKQALNKRQLMNLYDSACKVEKLQTPEELLQEMKSTASLLQTFAFMPPSRDSDSD